MAFLDTLDLRGICGCLDSCDEFEFVGVWILGCLDSRVIVRPFARQPPRQINRTRSSHLHRRLNREKIIGRIVQGRGRLHPFTRAINRWTFHLLEGTDLAAGAFQDEMDRLQLDQLHKVVLELSKNCFELKKLCITVLVSASVLIATFTHDSLNVSFFVGGAIIVGFFYIADVQSYYYQEKIRIRMKDIANEMADRANPKIQIAGVGMPISQAGIKKTRIQHAFLNASMLFYALLLAVDVLLGACFSIGYIK
jgi:hypothetical protein